MEPQRPRADLDGGLGVERPALAGVRRFSHQAMATSVGLGGAVTVLGGLVILVSGLDNVVGTIGFLVAVFASVIGQFVGLRQAKAAVERLTSDPAPG